MSKVPYQGQPQTAQVVADRQQELDEEALLATSLQTRDFRTGNEWAEYAEGLLLATRELEAQLSDPTFRTDNYWQWRKRARWNWLVKQSQYRHAKSMALQLKNGERLQRIRLESGTPEDLLHQLNGLVKSWIGSGAIAPRPDEERVLAQIQAYFDVRFDRRVRTNRKYGFAANAKLSETERLGLLGPELDAIES